MRRKLQNACSAWEPQYQKDKVALERVQRNSARFVTGNYDQTASVAGMLPDLKWGTLETMRHTDTQGSPLFIRCAMMS